LSGQGVVVIVLLGLGGGRGLEGSLLFVACSAGWVWGGCGFLFAGWCGGFFVVLGFFSVLFAAVGFVFCVFWGVWFFVFVVFVFFVVFVCLFFFLGNPV